VLVALLENTKTLRATQLALSNRVLQGSNSIRNVTTAEQEINALQTTCLLVCQKVNSPDQKHLEKSIRLRSRIRDPLFQTNLQIHGGIELVNYLLFTTLLHICAKGFTPYAKRCQGLFWM
jgi:hypothetical protein